MTQEPSTALAVSEQSPAAAMTLHPGRQFTPQEITLLRSTIAKDCTIPEVSLFVQACRHYQLDPFSRQIYIIVRGSGDNRQATIQISIDGFRVIAERNPEYAGQTPPEFLDTEGQWHEGVWLRGVYHGLGLPGEASGPYPVAARVGVLRKGWSTPIYGYAAWTEYAQFNRDKLGSMWEKMPGNQLAKCAESLALRKAFPNDLSGAYSHDEMAQEPGFRNVEIEGMTIERLDAGAAASSDDGSPPLEGEIVTPPRRAGREKSAEEQEWERRNPPVSRGSRPVQQARPAPQRTPAPPPVAAGGGGGGPAKPVRTVTQLLVWASGEFGMSEDEVLRACGVADRVGVQNLGVSKAIEAVQARAAAIAAELAAIEQEAARGAADAADQAGDIDPDDLPFHHDQLLDVPIDHGGAQWR